MIVVVAGMPRSGSTFSFNVVRELLINRGGVFAMPTNSLGELLINAKDSRHAIIKTHAPDVLTNRLLEKEGLPCICTIRKPEDAIASFTHAFRFSLQESVALCKEWLMWHQVMSTHVLNLRYEEIDKYPFLAVRKISRYLLKGWNLEEALRIWWQYRKSAVQVFANKLQENDETCTDIGFSYYDKQTFFHRRHISSLVNRPAVERLDKPQLQFVREELKDFVDKNGNYHW